MSAPKWVTVSRGMRSWHIRLGSREGGPGRAPSASAEGLHGWGSEPEGAQHIPPPRDPRAPQWFNQGQVSPGEQHHGEQCPHPKLSIKPRKEMAFRARMSWESPGLHLRACLVPSHSQAREGYRSLTQLGAVETAKLGLFFLRQD